MQLSSRLICNLDMQLTCISSSHQVEELRNAHIVMCRNYSSWCIKVPRLVKGSRQIELLTCARLAHSWMLSFSWASQHGPRRYCLRDSMRNRQKRTEGNGWKSGGSPNHFVVKPTKVLLPFSYLHILCLVLTDISLIQHQAYIQEN